MSPIALTSIPLLERIEFAINSEGINLSKEVTPQEFQKIVLPCLARSKWVRMWLLDNALGDFSCFCLRACPQFSQLRELFLNNNNITDIGLKSLCLALPGSNLEWINLSKNQLTDRGIVQLADVLLVSNIKVLWLENNLDIGDQAAMALAKNSSKLTGLWVGNNQIGDEGMRVLAKAWVFSGQGLFLSAPNNPIGPEMQIELQRLFLLQNSKRFKIVLALSSCNLFPRLLGGKSGANKLPNELVRMLADVLA